MVGFFECLESWLMIVIGIFFVGMLCLIVLIMNLDVWNCFWCSMSWGRMLVCMVW